jgi:hypothetical protein
LRGWARAFHRELIEARADVLGEGAATQHFGPLFLDPYF